MEARDKALKEKNSIKGNDIRLSLDINLRKEAEETFAERSGALVAIKPDTGELLGLVSRPTFDPNHFAKGVLNEDVDCPYTG